MKQLLLEIGVEELPAGFIEPALAQLIQLLTKRLSTERIDYSEVEGYSTPRRLAVIIRKIAEKQNDLAEEVKGPAKSIAYKDGKPTKAALGFARAQGVSAEELVVKKLGDAEYVFANRFVVGEPTKSVLERILPSLITAVSFPKNMRWGNLELRYARPLRWIAALLDDQIIEFSVENIKSGRITYGHRQLAVEPISVNHVQDYLTNLEAGYVIADHNYRRQMIKNQLTDLAKRIDGIVLEDQGLLNEVTHLVEFPTAFIGRYDEQFLAVPQEVLITTMKEHQRYFPVFDQNNQLMPYFIGVRNGTDNHLDLVVSGNEKVLRARLQDAKFFFDEDCKKPLEQYVDKLDSVVFHDGLGSMYDKVVRMCQTAKAIAQLLNKEDEQDVILRTAKLAKADLVTNMVNEFPELQGIIGSKYALLSGEDSAVANGIAEHYKPRFSGDELPKSTAGVIVGIADKLDNLVGYFGLGMIPTGSQDPFALRRQALGIVQVLLTNDIDIDVSQLIAAAFDSYCSKFNNEKQIITELLDFVSDRLRVILLDMGYRYDTINAVLAKKLSNLSNAKVKVDALDRFRQTEDFSNLYTAFERCSKLVAGSEHEASIDKDFFTTADRNFYDAIAAAEVELPKLLDAREYTSGLSVLAALKKPVDEFFEAVMIMDQDKNIRKTRLGLLQKLIALYGKYADFGLIVMDM